MSAAGRNEDGGRQQRKSAASLHRQFPWDEAIGFGLGVLRLPPQAFWSMTPRELAAAYRGLTGKESVGELTHEALLAMLDDFPDETETLTHGALDK